MRSLLLVCVVSLGGLGGTAHADKPTKAASAETAFRGRNPQTWSVVGTSPDGHVNHVVTDDAELRIRTLDKDGHFQWDDAAVARARALLRANADLFGIDPDDAERVGDGVARWATTITRPASCSPGSRSSRSHSRQGSRSRSFSRAST